jgi:hypothetical protein
MLSAVAITTCLSSLIVPGSKRRMRTLAPGPCSRMTKNALSPRLTPAPSPRNPARTALEQDGCGGRQADPDEKQLW